MNSCLFCNARPLPGKIACQIHSGTPDLSQLSPNRILLSSVIVTVLFGAILFGCYLGVRLVQLH